MLTFDRPNGRFNHRVAGACLHDDHVLLTRAEGEDYWILPGGRVELLEDTRTALRREMLEELGCAVEIGDPLWIVENFFSLAGESYHELAFVYEFSPSDATLLDPSWTSTTTDAGVTILFRWFSLDHLEHVNLKPAFLKTLLRDPPTSPQHLVIRE